MRSARNFHPQWGYLAPAPSFLRGARMVLVATAVGATAGAAVVVSLLGRPGADVDNSIAAHALVTSAPVSVAPPASTSAAVATGTAAPVVAAPAGEPVLAQTPAAAAPASPQPDLANASDAASANSAPSTASAPLAHADTAATAEAKPAAPAKRFVGRRRRTASNGPVRRWQGENVWRRRHWRDNGFPQFRLFSSRTGSSDYPN